MNDSANKTGPVNELRPWVALERAKALAAYLEDSAHNDVHAHGFETGFDLIQNKVDALITALQQQLSELESALSQED